QVATVVITDEHLPVGDGGGGAHLVRGADRPGVDLVHARAQDRITAGIESALLPGSGTVVRDRRSGASDHEPGNKREGNQGCTGISHAVEGSRPGESDDRGSSHRARPARTSLWGPCPTWSSPRARPPRSARRTAP